MKQLNRKKKEKDCHVAFHFQQNLDIQTLHHLKKQKEVMLQPQPTRAIKNTNKWAPRACHFPSDSHSDHIN